MGYSHHKPTMAFIMMWIMLALALVTMPPLLMITTRQADPTTARHVLEDDGYVGIILTERPKFTSFFAGCGKHYRFITPFEATLAGNRARGVVCSGGKHGQAPQVRRNE